MYVVPSAATAPLFGTNQPFLLLPRPSWLLMSMSDDDSLCGQTMEHRQ